MSERFGEVVFRRSGIQLRIESRASALLMADGP